MENKPNKKEAETRIKELKDILNKSGYEYYVLDNPTMSDFEYDRLMQDRLSVSAARSPTVLRKLFTPSRCKVLPMSFQRMNYMNLIQEFGRHSVMNPLNM